MSEIAQNDVAFGQLLKSYRVQAGLSQAALAERASISQRAVSDLERGARRAPQGDTLAGLARGLGLSGQQRSELEGLVVRHRRPRVTAVRPSPWATPRTDCHMSLPNYLTPILGRERESMALVALLLDDDARLVTVTGPGGVGKTRLTVHVATLVEKRLADGAYFVDLSQVRAADLVASQIARVIGVSEGAAGIDPDYLAHLATAIARRNMLLILDNFEHIVEAAPVVLRLLGRCPGLTVLVTSRENLRVRGEREFPLAPLALPDASPPFRVADLMQQPVVELFVQRARNACPDFALDEANVGAVVDVCRRLDGLPLAIELAAARIKVLSPRDLATWQGERLEVLTAGPRDLPPRLRTLRSAIDWSHDLLMSDEQLLFRRLAIFTGGCTLEAVCAVCARNETPGAVLDGLASLVDKNLLRRAGRAGEKPRFSMLETIRAYALERLHASDESSDIARRHALYYLSFAEATGGRWTGHWTGRRSLCGCRD